MRFPRGDGVPVPPHAVAAKITQSLLLRLLVRPLPFRVVLQRPPHEVRRRRRVGQRTIEPRGLVVAPEGLLQPAPLLVDDAEVEVRVGVPRF